MFQKLEQDTQYIYIYPDSWLFLKRLRKRTCRAVTACLSASWPWCMAKQQAVWEPGNSEWVSYERCSNPEDSYGFIYDDLFMIQGNLLLFIRDLSLFITHYLGFMDNCNPPKTLPWIAAFHQDSLKSSLYLCHRSHVFGILGSPRRLIFRGFPLDISRKYHRLAFT